MLQLPEIWINVTNGVLGNHVSLFLSFSRYILETEILMA